MLHECRATHVLTAIWNTDTWWHSFLNFGWGNINVGQTRLLKLKVFLQNINNLFTFVSKLQNVIYFYLRQLEIPKIKTSKQVTPSLLRAFYLCTVQH